jgi:hypothetical protein
LGPEYAELKIRTIRKGITQFLNRQKTQQHFTTEDI